MSLETLCWPMNRLGEGLEVLARRAGMKPVVAEPLTPPPSLAHEPDAELSRWIEWAGERLGIETESVDATLAGCRDMVLKAGPAVFQVPCVQGMRFALVLRSGGGKVRLIAPDLKLRSCRAEDLREALCRPLEAPLTPEIDRLLALADVLPGRRERARRIMLQERLADRRIDGCWILRSSPCGDFPGMLLQAGLHRRLLMMLGLFALLYVLELGAWGLIGEAALDGRLDLGWMLAWAMLLVSMVPLRLLGSWLDAGFGLDAGRILKKRLLAGALNMNVDAVRHLGVGQLLGRVIESQALEALAVNGGLGALVAILELCFAAWVLAMGAGSTLHVLLLAGWIVVTILLCRGYVHQMRRWTQMRLDLTHALVERMVGHRTRLAQERPHRRVAEEDQAMHAYLQQSVNIDGAIVRVSSLVPVGWLMIGLLGLAPGFVSGSASASGLAIGFGGVLLASRAFNGLSASLNSLAGAGMAWRQVAPFFKAAERKRLNEPFLSAAQLHGRDRAAPVIEAQGLVFRYQPQGEPVIKGLDLKILPGDKVLLQGPSGGGKSTLSALIAGLRQPDAGLLLLNGLDRHTLGDSWHRLATEAPQFHENHILAGTLGFNLLMGRSWPASKSDLEEARQLCVELGLGPLLDRMPAGLMQTVGETGWQLSHGERSRVFLARALLQKAQLTVMDESFAALDPETLRLCLACAVRRSAALVVVAHP